MDRYSVHDVDPRDVFMRQVDLPRGLEREHVFEHDHGYRLRGSESRTMTAVGAFRGVPASDRRDGQDKPIEPNRGDLSTSASRVSSRRFPPSVWTGRSSCSPGVESHCLKRIAARSEMPARSSTVGSKGRQS